MKYQTTESLKKDFPKLTDFESRLGKPAKDWKQALELVQSAPLATVGTAQELETLYSGSLDAFATDYGQPAKDWEQALQLVNSLPLPEQSLSLDTVERLTEKEKVAKAERAAKAVQTEADNDLRLQVEGSLGKDTVVEIREALKTGILTQDLIADKLEQFLTIGHNNKDIRQLGNFLVLIAMDGGEYGEMLLPKILAFIKQVSPFQFVVRRDRKTGVYQYKAHKQQGFKWRSNRPKKFWHKVGTPNKAAKAAKSGEEMAKAAARLAKTFTEDLSKDADYSANNLLADLAKELDRPDLVKLILDQQAKTQTNKSGK